MTPDERRDAFFRDLQSVLNKHRAELRVTDDGRPYGMHSGVVEVLLYASGELPYVEFSLPGFMTADPTNEGQP